jgi:branched-chain amino acid transport system substrate-binding protein
MVSRRLLCVGLLLVLAGCWQAAPLEPFPIGHLAPLTGPDKVVGEHAREAIDLAVEEINKVDRKTVRPAVVFHADTRGEGDTAQGEAVRLLSVNRVVALLDSTDEEQLERIVRAVQPYKVPLLTSSRLAPSVPAETVFSLTASPGYQGQVLAHFAAEELKADSVVALADSRTPAGTTLADAFTRECGKIGNVRVQQWAYKGNDDVGELAGRLKAAPPKAILFAGAASDLEQMRPQLHAAAPEAALLFGGAEGSWQGLAQDDSGKPLYLTTVFLSEGLSGSGEEVAQKYQERFHHELDARSALAYDGVRVLVGALRAVRPPDSAEVLKKLVATDNFEGLTGPLSFTKEHCTRRPVFVATFEAGRLKLAKRYDPEPQ